MVCDYNDQDMHIRRCTLQREIMIILKIERRDMLVAHDTVGERKRSVVEG